MAQQNGNGLPGIGTTRTATPRHILVGDAAKAEYVPGGRMIAGASSRDPLNTGDLDVLRAGMVMGKITSGGKYAPSILGVLPSAHDSDGTTKTTLTVSPATAVEINRRIGVSGTFNLVGPPDAGGIIASTTVTFSAVNVTTGVLTISDIAVDKVAGSFITPTDGSEVPLGLLNETYGVKVTDRDAVAIDVQMPRLLVGGMIDTTQIINAPTDVSLLRWLKSSLNARLAAAQITFAVGGAFLFDDTY